MLAGIHNCSSPTSLLTACVIHACCSYISSGCLNSLTTLGYFVEVYFRLWIPSFVHISTFAWSYIALEIWAKASLTHSLWAHDPNHTHSLASFQWSNSECSAWLKMAYRSGSGVPTRGEEWFLCPFVLTRWEMVQPVSTKAILQPAKAATMCTKCL